MIVFANQAPDTRMLTRDRWRIVNLDEENYVDADKLQELKALRARVAKMNEAKAERERKEMANKRVLEEIKELAQRLEEGDEREE